MERTPRQHIEDIRREKYWIGVGTNPVSKDLRMAVKYLSAELYSKDVHFLMELVQNAEDNDYREGVDPSLEFVFTSRDITGTGALATLLIFNNEKGFSPRNIESICSVGDSTKVGNRKRGYIGEKGIGFKSVFLLTAQPYIFSNGYQIRFSEKPCPSCDIAYIVPEWVDESPTVSDIKQIYGYTSAAALPTTTIILPLKPDKIEKVRKPLYSIHPELLLFLSKIRRLSVTEANEDSSVSGGVSTVRAISISSQIDFMQKKNIDAESYTLHLSAGEEDSECAYYMWRQRFPVKHKNKEERRMDVEEWSIALAFPRGDRPHGSGISKSAGIYAFLPTEMVTNFPFVVQADFILASSRETILLDNVWNQGILDCVPAAFMNAFVSQVKTSVDAPVSSLITSFSFLPIQPSEYQELNVIRQEIRQKLLQENIIPSESHSSSQKLFHKPCDVGRILSDFWDTLMEAKDEGVQLCTLSSHGKYILHSSFDRDMYNEILKFLGVEYVGLEWYSKCIQSCSLVSGVSEAVYVKLLLFIAENWEEFKYTNIKDVPLLKYIESSGVVSLLSIHGATLPSGPRLCRSLNFGSASSWLINCSSDFKCAGGFYFFPETLQPMFNRSLLSWLDSSIHVKAFDVCKYACSLLNSLTDDDSNLPILFAHFLYHSLKEGHLSEWQVRELCKCMPLVDRYGQIRMEWNGVLVPAIGSKWMELMGSNPWKRENYVDLGENYLRQQSLAGQLTLERGLMNFLKMYVNAADIPDICPPNTEFPGISSPLRKENAFVLLDWIRKIKSKGSSIPDRFLECIKTGNWLKVTMSGCSGYRSPSESFFHSSSWGSLLQNCSVMVDIPLVDQGFYGSRISSYKEELKTIGVMFEFSEACRYIGNHLMSLASRSSLTNSNVLTMLDFIRFLRKNYLPPDDFIASVKGGKWLRTSCGYRYPEGSVLYDDSWKDASLVSDIPFISNDYGEEIYRYKDELQLLGVLVGFHGSYNIVADHLRSWNMLTNLSAQPLILLLKCIRWSSSSSKLLAGLKDVQCIKSSCGYRYPRECFLSDPNWCGILQVFKLLPSIDQHFYGDDIFNYATELRLLDVLVDFEGAISAFSSIFRQQASKCSITKENVLSLLACYKMLKEKRSSFPADFRQCLREAKWLRTRLGNYRSPKDCILFGPDWESISQITLLPFIDDGDCWYGQCVHDYKRELKSMGVIVDLTERSSLVLSCIYLPVNPGAITPSSVLCLLENIKSYMAQGDSLPGSFLEKINKKWLKTTFGYKPPNECCLFDSKWASVLQRGDGPFIDEDYYGSSISSYGKELGAMGVIIDDEKKASSLVAGHLEFHTKFTTIVRIYNFLQQPKWDSGAEGSLRIYIPRGSNDNGSWVSHDECVLHDKEDLFGSYLYVLDKIYKPELLHFFCQSVGVRNSPSTDNYLRLWKDWEGSERCLSHTECSAFWGHVVRHWSSRTEEAITNSMLKVPAAASGSSGEVVLLNKNDVFIPDDLLLKEFFEKSSPHPLFVWCPRSSMQSVSQSRLFEIYRKIGVKTISESVAKDETSAVEDSRLIASNLKGKLIRKGLIRLILGFLADEALKMEPEARHKLVRGLVGVTVYEMPEPIMVGYSLSLSSGESIEVGARRMIRWEREDSEFLTQKLDRSGKQRNRDMIEYAINFSEVVSEGILWEREEHIPRLSELIRLGFLLNFSEDAIDYYMKSENLQIFMEDEEFLSSVFPPDGGVCVLTV